jgi:hypothetical protein
LVYILDQKPQPLRKSLRLVQQRIERNAAKRMQQRIAELLEKEEETVVYENDTQVQDEE